MLEPRETPGVEAPARSLTCMNILHFSFKAWSRGNCRFGGRRGFGFLTDVGVDRRLGPALLVLGFLTAMQNPHP